jgi:hypothetical protein
MTAYFFLINIKNYRQRIILGEVNHAMAKDRRKVKEVLTTNNSLAWGHLNNTHPMPAGSIAFASPQAIGRMAEDRKRSPDKA